MIKLLSRIWLLRDSNTRRLRGSLRWSMPALRGGSMFHLRLLMVSSVLLLGSALLIPIVAMKAQNRVAGEGRVARAAQVTGTSPNSQAKVSGNTFTYECLFDGPAKVDDYALVSSMVNGECHDSGISSKEPRPKQWKDNQPYLVVIKQVNGLGDVIIGSIVSTNVTTGWAGWITDTGAKVANPELAKQQLKSLRELAHKKGLRWRIHCLDSADPDRTFFAYAELRSTPPFAEYIEEGAKPWWVLRAASEDEAVKELYIAIQGAPNIYPEHKPTKKHKPCPAPLEGE